MPTPAQQHQHAQQAAYQQQAAQAQAAEQAAYAYQQPPPAGAAAAYASGPQGEPPLHPRASLCGHRGDRVCRTVSSWQRHSFQIRK